MPQEKAVVGFIGAGAIARSHAYSISSLKYFYNDLPEIEKAAVCSATESSRNAFSRKYDFSESCDLDHFLSNKEINTVFILGPNKVHFEHLRAVMTMSAIKRIYLEKPVCSGHDEEMAIASLVRKYPYISIQVGFQYLYSPSIREALALWKSGIMGRPLHFDLRYYHSDYLRREYRDKRSSRLTPAPDGGAMADLGSHAISILIAFLGENLRITGSVQAGSYDDVPDDSDLFSQISVFDESSGAVGSLAASRISSGTGDNLSFEFYAEGGAIRYSSDNADFFEYYLSEKGLWNRKVVGSNYLPVTSFPSGHVPAGWLRAMVHAHYVFLNGVGSELFIPDIGHGLAVQRLVTQTAEHLKTFRTRREKSKL